MKMTTRRARTNRTERMVAETSELGPRHLRHADRRSRRWPARRSSTACEPRELARVLAEFDEVHFPSGRRIVLEGLRGSDFFLVVVGKAAVLVDGWRVATLGPGDFFGEIAILGDGLRSASVRAETPLHCLVLPNGKLETADPRPPAAGHQPDPHRDRPLPAASPAAASRPPASWPAEPAQRRYAVTQTSTQQRVDRGGVARRQRVPPPRTGGARGRRSRPRGPPRPGRRRRRCRARRPRCPSTRPRRSATTRVRDRRAAFS